MTKIIMFPVPQMTLSQYHILHDIEAETAPSQYHNLQLVGAHLGTILYIPRGVR